MRRYTRKLKIDKEKNDKTKKHCIVFTKTVANPIFKLMCYFN